MVLSWLHEFLPGRLAVDARERWRCVIGAAVGIAFTAWMCHLLAPHLTGGSSAAAWLVAPMGASAVLVFAVPASPMAQPWAVVGGNAVCALVGIACVHLFGTAELAAACAVALAVGAMFALRCLHPPGGSTALLMVLTGMADPVFAATPVMLNAALLVVAGIAYNTLTGRRYPHGQRRADAAPSPAGAAPTAADLDAALARYNQVLDVSPDDLQQLLAQTEIEGYRRRMGQFSYADVMSRQPIAVNYGTPLQEAWALLRQRHIKALPVELVPLFASTGHHHIPVVDGERRLVGIITQSDLVAALCRQEAGAA